MSQTVIPFGARERVLAKAHAYLCHMDELVRDGDQAVDALIDALRVADNEMKLKIVLMLGTMADLRVIESLYELMTDCGQSDSLRHAAALQLSLVAGRVPDNNGLRERLVADLHHADPCTRAHAALALGWEGNQAGVAALVGALRDPDTDVQQAAVSALTNIKDDRLFAVLTERLISSPKEQQRCILYHLCCFALRRHAVVQICTRYLSHPDADLRYDALVVLDAVSGTDKPLPLFLRCLQDPDPRIREVALVYLAAEDKRRLAPLETKVRPLARDPVANIRRVAVQLLHRICDGPVAMPKP